MPKREFITLSVVRELLADLPGVKEGFPYGTRAFRVRNKLIARMHQKEDAVVVKTGFDEREKLMQGNLLTYYLTDHYLNYPWVLVRLPTGLREELRDLLIKAWRRAASKSQIAEFESARK